MEEKNKIEELLRRAKTTAKSKYQGSARLEQHHRFAQGSVALLCCALISIPLTQVLEVDVGFSERALNMGEVILAMFILVFSLLLVQENFMSRSEAMNRDGMELSSFARMLAGLLERSVMEEEYQSLVNKYYAILEKGESHKTIDFLFINLGRRPAAAGEWPLYLFQVFRVYTMYAFLFSHYVLAIGSAAAALYLVLSGVLASAGLIH